MVKKIANIEEYIHDNYRNVTELMGTILGNVSVGINKNSNEKHVLKLCNKYRSHTRLESAEMEIKIMEELCNNKSNNFLVNLICVIQDNAKYLIILEYVNGGDLLDLIQNNFAKGLPIQKIKKWGKQLLKGLQLMHDNGYCHLDISCENILYDKNTDSIKICDFGLARKMIPNEAFPVERGQKRGKPGYMAIEILEYQSYYGYSADVFSLGVVFWIMFTGLPPFEQANKVAVRYFGNPKGLSAIIQSWKQRNGTRHVTRIPSDCLNWLAKMFTTKYNRISINELLKCDFFNDVELDDEKSDKIDDDKKPTKNVNNNDNNNIPNGNENRDDSKSISMSRDESKHENSVHSEESNTINISSSSSQTINTRDMLTQNKSRNEIILNGATLEQFKSISLNNNKKRRNSMHLEYSSTILHNFGANVNTNIDSIKIAKINNKISGKTIKKRSNSFCYGSKNKNSKLKSNNNTKNNIQYKQKKRK